MQEVMSAFEKSFLGIGTFHLLFYSLYLLRPVSACPNSAGTGVKQLMRLLLTALRQSKMLDLPRGFPSLNREVGPL